MIRSKLPHVGNSIFSIMSRMANKYEAINLSQGFPNFESDPKLIQLVNRAMHEGANQYAPMPGDFELRKVLSEKVKSIYGQTYQPETEITITAGATQAIFTAIACTISKGDEVIIFTPAYDCYAPTVQLFGGIVKSVQLNAPLYAPDWEQVKDTITSATKMIIVNSPHNPTGSLLSELDMLILQQLADAHDLIVISDEVYEHIIFDGQMHQSAAKFEGLARRCFITASFGKTFHNTGWKMGYCLAPQYLMEEFRKVHQYNVFCVNHPMQKAFATYLQVPDHYRNLGSYYQQKRDYFLNEIQNSRFKLRPTSGTYFQLLDYSEITDEKDTVFAEKLTKEYGLATIPTSVFNKHQEDHKQLRVCFAKTKNTLKEAAQILNSI